MTVDWLDVLILGALAVGELVKDNPSKPAESFVKVERTENGDLEKEVPGASETERAEFSTLEPGDVMYVPVRTGEDATAPAPTAKTGTPAALKDIKFHFGEFRLICLTYTQTTLLLLRATAWQLQSLFEFKRSEQLPYFSQIPDSLYKDAILQLVDEITLLDLGTTGANDQAQIPPDFRQSVVTVLDAENSKDLLAALEKMNEEAGKKWVTIIEAAKAKFAAKKEEDNPELYEETKKDLESIKTNQRLPGQYDAVSLFKITSQEQPDLVIFSWPEELGPTLLKALMKAAAAYRDSKLPHSPHDRLAFHAGHYLLSQGQNPFNRYRSRSLGTIGFKKENWQTYLSLTDPGQGHVFGTTTRDEWMQGVIVHVEHLERPANTTQAQIESYRIPSGLEFSRVCLHTGYTAPNTCYVGRPLRDSGEFKYDFIKIVDTVAAACSNMFHLGAAECKIAMSGVKSSDMVAYMRALRGHTLKNYRQFFSAAFNLNTPLVDDIAGKYISDPIEIGERAIEIAALGGFDKVTWDGASDSYPSIPLLQADSKADGLLSLQNATKLVHLAHSAGLTTYFSAGFKRQHVRIAVYSGVDGIGIGGAQVLRSMDPKSKMHGEYLESRIDGLIQERDNAAKSTPGQAALLLARYDQMYFEGSINKNELAQRRSLYEVLQDEEPSELGMEDILNSNVAKAVLAIPDDKEEPWKGRVGRLLTLRHNGKPLLETHGGGNWESFKASLTAITREGDIHSFSMSKQWKDMREQYRKWLLTEDKTAPKSFMGEIDVNLKVTPFSGSKDLIVSDLFPQKTSNAASR